VNVTDPMAGGVVSGVRGDGGLELSASCGAFLAAGEAWLKTRPARRSRRRDQSSQAKVGDLTMTNELLATRIEHLEASPAVRPIGKSVIAAKCWQL
jgi:hypothetical protein